MTYDDSKKHINFWAKAFFAALGPFLGAAGLSAGSASAGSAVSETVLHSFCQVTNCADGEQPSAGLIATTNGGLYGTTNFGGNADAGVAFLVSITGGTGLLHVFQGGVMDGANPEAPLFRDKSGNFFGTTAAGGATGNGTIFERSAGGVYRLRHAFNGADGSGPYGFVADSADNLYGTTFSGGANGKGTIFRIAPSGILTTLHSFCSMTNCADGNHAATGLIGDANGNLYGTTFRGGASTCSFGCGVVFKIHADGTGYTVLHTFMGGTGDGATPLAGLSADASGNLYGTTENGGANGSGTVFKLAPDGSTYTYAVLYNFCSLASCADGSNPYGGVIVDADGNLYGTAFDGGANQEGVVFALTPSGAETVLYSFCNTKNANGFCIDGSEPGGNLVALGNGSLYGTTAIGGTMDAGTVYQLTNTGFVP
jgi:uncharacterized repeat protein (TIGR03803 family)